MHKMKLRKSVIISIPIALFVAILVGVILINNRKEN